MTAKAKTKTDKKPETRESPKRESPATDENRQLDRELDRELADSFPASDPPSVTQPSVKSGAPGRKPSSRK
jgi:hypothetical protein